MKFPAIYVNIKKSIENKKLEKSYLTCVALYIFASASKIVQAFRWDRKYV